MKALTREWIKKAEGDFYSCVRENRARRRPNHDGRMFARLLLLACVVFVAGSRTRGAESVPTNSSSSDLRIATFDIDATPPIGSWMAFDPVTNTWEMGLRARGIALLGAGEPIVLCAVDWIGIANEGQDAFRSALAKAAGT